MIPPHLAQIAKTNNKASKGKRNIRNETSQNKELNLLFQRPVSVHQFKRQDQFKWELSDTMGKYANDRLNIFIQEKDLKESILKNTPVLSKKHNS